MRNYIMILLFFGSSCSFLNAQEMLVNQIQDSINFDNKINKNVYQIELCDLPLRIELSETLDGRFYGNVSIILENYFEVNRETFVGKIPIKKSLVKELIAQFGKIALESLKNCNENDDCEYGLDGSETEFKIKSKGIFREYSFWNLIPNQNITVETPENRKRGQQILNLIDKKLDLKLKYTEMRQKLPKGQYSYWAGNAIVSFKIE